MSDQPECNHLPCINCGAAREREGVFCDACYRNLPTCTHSWRLEGICTRCGDLDVPDSDRLLSALLDFATGEGPAPCVVCGKPLPPTLPGEVSICDGCNR